MFGEENSSDYMLLPLDRRYNTIKKSFLGGQRGSGLSRCAVIVAWSTYGFETAVCYTRELKNPKIDTFKAIFFSGLLCIVFFLIPFAVHDFHGVEGMTAPTWLIGLNTVLAFVNALFLGAGAKVWGYSTAFWAGLIFAALIIPVFAYQHYIQDGGQFPKEAQDDLGIVGGGLGERKAGILPYLTLIAGAAVVLWANWFFVLPG